jgi:hypothetical protein
VKIRFLMTIPTEYSAFHRGQVIDVPKPTPEMLAWLKPLPDGSQRAEIVRDDEPELATVTVKPERAAKRLGKIRADA